MNIVFFRNNIHKNFQLLDSVCLKMIDNKQNIK